MRTLIFQYHNSLPEYRWNKVVGLSKANIQAYAKRVGADYKFFDQPVINADQYGLLKYQTYEKLRPIWDDWFLQYDRIISVDSDFLMSEWADDELITTPLEHLAMAPSTWCYHKEYRMYYEVAYAMWQHFQYYGNGHLTLDSGDILWYNSGLMVWTNEGLQMARKLFRPIKEHKKRNTLRINGDESYLNNMIKAHPEFKCKTLHPEWNHEMVFESDYVPKGCHYSGDKGKDILDESI